MPGIGGCRRYGRPICRYVWLDVPNAAGYLCDGTGWSDFQTTGTAMGPNECTGHRNVIERFGSCFSCHGHSAGGAGRNDVNRNSVGIHIGIDLCAGIALSAAQYIIGGIAAGSVADTAAT